MWRLTAKLSLCWLLCFSLLAFATPASASYAISEQELTRLDAIFSQLEQNSLTLQADLAESKKDLQTVRLRLIDYELRLGKLSAQLETLRTESQQTKQQLQTASDSLERVNKSLDAYGREVKSLKLQRAGLIVTILAVAVMHR